MSTQLVCLLIVAVVVLVAASAVMLRRHDRNPREAAGLPPPRARPDIVTSPLAAVRQDDARSESVQERSDLEPMWMRAPSFEGQVVYVETFTGKFVLKLRDRENGVYDAVHVVKSKNRVVEERFQMRFMGTLMTHCDMRHGMFVSGGRLRYGKVYAELELPETLSSVVVRVLLSSESSRQQAS